MLDKTKDVLTNAAAATELAAAAADWLARFESAVARPDPDRLKPLFHPDSHWRDVLALTWDIGTVSGADAVVRELNAHAGRATPGNFRIDPAVAARGNMRAFKERVGRGRPRGEAYSRDFRGPNWLDLRKSAAEYADRDPVVLVVGGGQAGLSIAARLKQLDVDTLIVDREARIGDNWRTRYHALTLHNQVQVNHLPYMPFPPNWPTYIPKDKLASWFEAYVEAMELNFWTGTEFAGGSYDEAQSRWTVELRRADGTTRRMRPRHVVMGTGV